MEGDVKLLEELMKRLPTDTVRKCFENVKRQRITRVAETISKRLKKDTSDLSIIDVGDTETAYFILLQEYEIEVFKGCTNIVLLDIRTQRMFSSVLKKYKRAMAELDNFPDHVKRKFLTLTGLRQDVTYYNDTFKETLGASFIGRVAQDYFERVEACSSVPLYYIHQEAYTVLAIHKFRRDSVIARLPKDILRIILELLWPPPRI